MSESGMYLFEIHALRLNRIKNIYADINEITRRYNPESLSDGWNTLPDGEEIYYVSNPAVGLWAVPERFTDN